MRVAPPLFSEALHPSLFRKSFLPFISLALQTNPAKVTLPFEFRWEDTDALLDNPSFYVLSPSKGVVPPSSKMDISLEFTPTELAVFKRFLVCSFPSLPYGEKTRKMTVDATAVRPICHFDLPPSDYRDRREQTNLPALDPKIQVAINQENPRKNGI
ncbi:hypothetical protein TGCAST_387810 [Toxoplasma gondii CAST]|uniref:Uncharacterized protein n=1 Tax=Toxoplasma gondii CAST TaxID=943122 RepID=A0A425I325_TOXGO|nr:hypothetical protein TGCAST_387810 [Toxoplasma gondii CAST]